MQYSAAMGNQRSVESDSSRTVTAERASILWRYTALRQSGGRSKSDSVVQITKEHGVAL